MSGVEGRTPPSSVEAEESVIGAVLLDNRALDVVVERGVQAEDFFLPSNRAVFEAMLRLHRDTRPIDVVTVVDEMRRSQTEGSRTVPVDVAKLVEMAARVPTAANVGFYANILVEKASRRSMIAAAGEITGRAYDDRGDTQGFLDWSEHRVFEVARRTERHSYVTAGSLIVDAVQAIESRHRMQQEITGVKSGLCDLDRITAGLQPGDLCILAGRPSVGKTALALNIALNGGVPTLIFSIEMDKAALTERLIASAGRLDGQRMRTGHLVGQEWATLTRAATTVAEAPIVIDDSDMITAMQIRSKARRWRADKSAACFPDGPTGKLGLVVVDYLQLIAGNGDAQNREREVAENCNAMKGLAKELGVPVMILAALKRPMTKMLRSQPPALDDLRESGSLEYAADVVLFVHRPPKPAKKSEDEWDADAVQVIVAKQRNGPTGTANVLFRREFSRFESRSARDDEEGPAESPGAPEQQELAGVA